MPRLQRAAVPENHAPRQIRRTETPPQFAIDEVADAPGRQPGRHARRHKVHHLQPGPLARARKPELRNQHAQQTAVKTHAALPDRQNLQRMRSVVSRLVKQAVAEAPANDHAHDTQKQDVFNVPARPGAGAGDAGVRLMPQA